SCPSRSARLLTSSPGLDQQTSQFVVLFLVGVDDVDQRYRLCTLFVDHLDLRLARLSAGTADAFLLDGYHSRASWDTSGEPDGRTGRSAVWGAARETAGCTARCTSGGTGRETAWRTGRGTILNAGR